MALTDAERKARQRDRQAERDEVTRAAKTFVPQSGERQDRAVKYALWHLDAWKRGEIAYPPAPALSSEQSSRPGLRVSSRPDFLHPPERLG